MSEKLGWLRYKDNQEEVFLGHSVSRAQHVSEETARLIDSEVRRLIEEAEAAARGVLTEHIEELHRLAGALLEYETLNGEESKKAIRGEDIGREDPANRRPLLPSGGTSIPSTRRPRGGGIGGPAPQGA
jgi:cell division protease FtsH